MSAKFPSINIDDVDLDITNTIEATTYLSAALVSLSDLRHQTPSASGAAKATRIAIAEVTEVRYQLQALLRLADGEVQR